jgi:hypothetical protein
MIESAIAVLQQAITKSVRPMPPIAIVGAATRIPLARFMRRRLLEDFDAGSFRAFISLVSGVRIASYQE